MSKIEEHLGDGAFVEFTGFSFRLWCERENGIHEVFLEPSALAALNDFAERCCGHHPCP